MLISHSELLRILHYDPETGMGYTATAEEAQELYRAAAEKHHGEFARAR